MTEQHNHDPAHIEGEFYKKRVLVFFDILGFKAMIEGTREKAGKPCNPDAIRKISEVMKAIRHFCDHMSPEVKSKEGNPQKHLGITYQQFSDCVVFSMGESTFKSYQWILLFVQSLQQALFRKNVLLRGGMIEGQLIHNSERIFGPAMMDAYELEVGVAVYPRIVVADDLVAAMRTVDPDEHLNQFLIRDSDGMWFVNYVDVSEDHLFAQKDMTLSLYKNIRETVKKYLHTKPAIRQKYLWIALRYNQSLAKVQRKVVKTGYPREFKDLVAGLPMIDIDSKHLTESYE